MKSEPMSVADRMPLLQHQPEGHVVFDLRNGRLVETDRATVEDFIDAGICFAGTPDMVVEQMKAFWGHVGGFGHLLMMGQGGHITHEDTVDNLTMFSKEVLPRLAQGL